MAIPSVPDNRKYLHHPSTGLYMARMGNTFCAKAEDLDTLSAGVVPAATGNYVAIPEGSSAVVTCFYLFLSTVDDQVGFVIGYTSGADGTGDFVGVTPTFHIFTGDKRTAAPPNILHLDPPMYITYSTTSKAIAVKITTNDDDAIVTYGLNGWLEETG